MCGILGFVGFESTLNDDTIARYRDVLMHRGPDDGGLWRSASGDTVLAQRRLSIIDLSPAGHQPMADREGRLHIVLNGEIYNYQELRGQLRSLGSEFRSGTDTEVVLEAYRVWGHECVAHLSGMFSFVIHDARSGKLFGARDRAGEKPLFYWHDGARFCFASELKALLANPNAPRTLDAASLDWYLAYGYVPGGRCILAGYQKLPPAHAFTFDIVARQFCCWKYWNLPAPPLEHCGDDEELLEEFNALLADAVRHQLVADVPVGVLLSGGIDSSLVTAMAARVSPVPVRTFTISFPGHDGFDESAYARIVASHFGTIHTELQAEPASVELLPTLARQYDEPIADSSMVPTYLVSRLIRQQATVALGGDGGDELFGGYAHHAWVSQHQAIRRLVPRAVRRVIHNVATSLLPVGLRGRNYLLGYTADLDENLAQWGLFFDCAARCRLLKPWVGAAHGDNPEHHKRESFSERGSVLQRVTASDYATYLPDDILVKVDRAAMLASLEVRAPFLDASLIEFAFGRVPDRLRATRHERKILPRRLAARLLPRELDLTRKQGFSIPLQRWFKGPWGVFMEEVLRSADSALFDRGAISDLIAAQRRGRANTNRLFALTMFELWRREYKVTLS